MHIKKKFIHLLLAVCLLLLVSCNKEQSVINDYTALVEEVEANGDDFTEQQWEDYTQRCEEVETEMQQYDFNREQKQEIRKLQGRMAAAIGKHSETILKNAAKDALEQIETFSEGFMEGINEKGNK